MSFDIVIHCNNLNCRKELHREEKACVTSCSHIFCLDCANVKFIEALVCPACQSDLTKRNDIVIIQLSPSEEYKSSVLAGLSPDTIMDICNRALSFYNYQVSQELYYREALQQSLQERSDQQQSRLQAESMEMHRLLKAEKNKSQAIAKEFELEKRRNHDLQSEIHNKSKQFTKLQQMYEKLKHKSMGSRIQQSVQDSISNFNPTNFNPTTISSIPTNNKLTQFHTPISLKNQQQRTPSPILIRPSGHHDDGQFQQRRTNMTTNAVDSTRHEISRYEQQPNTSFSAIGIRATNTPPTLHHPHDRPTMSLIGSVPRTNIRSPMHQREKTQYQHTQYR